MNLLFLAASEDAGGYFDCGWTGNEQILGSRSQGGKNGVMLLVGICDSGVAPT